MARRILVTSGKGGVGKTTIVANLGYTLARSNLKVLLLDTDFGLNNLDVVMGIENKIVYDIIDVLEGKCTPRQAIIQDFHQPNLYIFPSNHTYCNAIITEKLLNEILNSLEDFFDYILLDCPAGVDIGFRRAVECSGEAIVVTTPHISALRDCDKIIGILKTFCVDNYFVVINRARGDLMLDNEMLDVETIASYLNKSILGVVPDDDIVNSQLLMGGAVNVECDFVKSIEMIAENLHNGTNKIFNVTKRYKGIIGTIRRNLRKIV